MQVLTVALFQRTGAIGNSLLIQGDDVDFLCCLHSHALSIYQNINSVAITLRFHTTIS